MTSERFCYLHVTDQYTLGQFGGNLRNAFPTAIGILHVGSSAHRPTWRDVDVRIVLPDDEYDQLAAITDPKVLAVALSIWGQQFTRLPIDCQVQRFSDQLPEGHLPRHSIGGLPL